MAPKPLWRNDVAVIVSLPLGAAAALDEELARPITAEVGFEYDMVWSTWHGARRAQGAHFLKCTSLRVTANSLARHDGRFAHHIGLDPGSGLGLVRRGAR